MQMKYLQGLGIPSHDLCNMVATTPHLLTLHTEAQVKPVVDYLIRQGVKGTPHFPPTWSVFVPLQQYTRT